MSPSSETLTMKFKDVASKGLTLPSTKNDFTVKIGEAVYTEYTLTQSIDADTKQPVPISHGTVGEVNITGCIKSERGEPGQLSGEFASQDVVGSIRQNVAEGVFGMLDGFPIEGKAIPLGFKQEIRRGSAEILSTVKGGTPERYTVEIESVDMSDGASHDMVVHVTDKKLLEEAGGIVQGMSGSPIIQDGRLVGAVTHVFVDDPTRGYAIFADDMYRRSCR